MCGVNVECRSLSWRTVLLFILSRLKTKHAGVADTERHRVASSTARQQGKPLR